MYQRLRAHAGQWDMIVVGGGATGAGVAIDAATAVTTCSCWSRATSARAPPAAAPSWCMAACVTWNRATSRSSWKPQGARPAASERAPPGPQPGLHSAQLRLVGSSVSTASVSSSTTCSPASTASGPRAFSPRKRRWNGCPPSTPKAPRRGHLLRRPVRRFPPAHQPGDHRL